MPGRSWRDGAAVGTDSRMTRRMAALVAALALAGDLGL
jgi:hypothetical protein